MNRLKAHKIVKEARAFALTEPTTNIYQRLDPPFIFPKNRVGTYMEYIWRLILEGLDILDRGDSLVKKPRFTRHDILRAEKGIQSLERAITAPHILVRRDLTLIQGLPDALGKIITYHLDKASACNIEQSRLEAHAQQVRTDFINACRDGNYVVLAKLYPYLGNTLDIDGDDALPMVLKGKMDLPQEWYEQARISALKGMFKGASSLNPGAVASYLGNPDDGIGPYTLAGLNFDRERNLTIYKDAQGLIQCLANAVGKPSPVNIDPTIYINNTFPHDRSP